MHLEIVIGGIGGQGALTAGQLLAVAGMKNGKWVTNTPVYSPEVRERSNALVVISTNDGIHDGESVAIFPPQSVGGCCRRSSPGAGGLMHAGASG